MGRLKKVGMFLGVLFFSVSSWAQTAAPWTPSKSEGNFLLLSDIHFDPYADQDLAKKLAAAPVEEWEALFQSGASKTVNDYGKDTNHALFTSALNEIAATGLKYDYAIVTGDFISHTFKDTFHKLVGGDEKAYEAFVLKSVLYVTQSLQKALKGKPVYFCLGNNDSDWNDYGGVMPGSAFLSSLAKGWSTVAADPQAVSDFSFGGYYAVPHPTLKKHLIVGLNDVFWSMKYDPCVKLPADFDPVKSGQWEKKEMDWLAGVLKAAKARGEKVTILSHMPPGIHSRNASEHTDRKKPQHTFYVQKYLWNFLNLLAAYRDTVDVQFAGHTHLDDFRVVRDRSDKKVVFTHVGPALTPIRHNNPEFQVMLYDRGTGALKDMATYELGDLKNPGSAWKLEYTFREAYGAKAYDFDSLLLLAKAIEEDPTIRSKYVRFATGECQDDPPVTDNNWRFFSCAHLLLDPVAYMACYQ